MNGIGSFLDKFKHILRSDIVSREIVVSVLKDVLGANFEPSRVSIKNGTAKISAHPVFKSEIVFRKIKILEELKKRGAGHIKDLQ